MRKQLLYLTNNQLTAYLWDKGSLSDGQGFRNDKEGWQAFTGYLADKQNIPTYLLIDLIEEAFQRDTIPHVLGKARRTLIQRRLGQLYQGTPFRQGSIQGREKDGRKDDQVLFSALTNAALPKPWTAAILAQSVPLAGIFSLALLSPILFKKLGLANGPLLLVTHQSSGLRQSYLQDGTLRFSRLTPLLNSSPDAFADTVAAEIAKTRQFLASTRQLPGGTLINIAIVASDRNLSLLQAVCPDTSAVAHRFIPLEEAAHALRLKQLHGASTCDPLFLSVLGGPAPAGHYPLFEQTRFYKLWQTRIAVYGLSIATVAIGVSWVAVTAMDAFGTRQKNREMDMEIRNAEVRYQAVLGTMPSTIAKPQNMKSAVDIERMIAQNAPDPVTLFGIVSNALDRLPEIQINQMQWQVSEVAGTATSLAPPPPPPAGADGAAVPATLIGIPKKPYQILIVEGQVEPFQHDYRTALESVRQFTVELAKNKQLKLEVIQQPLDIRPTVKLDGKAGNEDDNAKARFILRLLWTP